MGQYDDLAKGISALKQYEPPELWKMPEATAIFNDFKQLLNEGKIRAAEKFGDDWVVNLWVKEGILLGMRLGRLREYMFFSGLGAFPSQEALGWEFFDKDTYPFKKITIEDNIRIVPGGSSVRDGAYLAPGVVMMPPAYVNVGAYVDEGTMIDSHALVGSCAQVGKKVHLSAAVQIGGVLEPVGAMPVIIEDEVMVGGNCGIYEGTIVRERAVIGTGVILNGSTPVYDFTNGKIYRKTSDSPLIIPAGAVVVAGSRRIKGDFALEHGLSIYTPLIIKYRDGRTDSATALEDALR